MKDVLDILNNIKKVENVMKTKYLLFKEMPTKGKTKKYDVISLKDAFTLGEISWERGWRQYIFAPFDKTIWSKGCLNDVASFLSKLNKDHLEELKETRKRKNQELKA